MSSKPMSLAGRASVVALVAFAATVLSVSLVRAAAPEHEILAVGIDRKFAYDDAGKRQALEPGRDEVAFYDIKDPAKPALLGAVPLENSIVGPPTNIAITPNQSLALIASALRSDRTKDNAGWTSAPSDDLHVVDLDARPPKLINTLKVGSQPSGIAVSRDGRLGLVANRNGKSITVLRIAGQDVTVAATVPMGDTVTSVAITPDGRRALATKFAAHKVALLTIGADGDVAYSGQDLPVGLYPWTVTVSPAGDRALVTNIGANAASDGNAKTVSVIDLDAGQARVAQHVSVGDAPEGISVSTDGKLAAATILQGSYDAPKGAPYRNDVGLLTLFRLGAGRVDVAESVPVEAFPEGVAFSGNGRVVYVGNFASSSLSIVALDERGRVTGQRVLKLSGPPASLRIGSR